MTPDHVEILGSADLDAPSCELPVYLTRVPAGFPSPAGDYEEGQLDLNTHLIANPSSTFFVRVTGDSMKDGGIHSGALLIVDRSLRATDGKVVIAVIDGELTVKRLRIRQGRPKLVADNPAYPPIELGEDQACEIWGVVTTVIQQL